MQPLRLTLCLIVDCCKFTFTITLVGFPSHKWRRGHLSMHAQRRSFSSIERPHM
jgi:hypothetical protein